MLKLTVPAVFPLKNCGKVMGTGLGQNQISTHYHYRYFGNVINRDLRALSLTRQVKLFEKLELELDQNKA